MNEVTKTLDSTWARAQIGLRNARLNTPHITLEQSIVRTVFDPEIRESDTLLVFGSGASAMRYESVLPELAQGRACFVSPTNAGWFDRNSGGRTPDLLVNIDSHPRQSDLIRDTYDYPTPKMWPVVAVPPETNHDMVALAPSQMRWFHYFPQGENKNEMHPYDYFMRLMFTGEGGVIDKGFAQMGAVTLTMIAIAEHFKRDRRLSYKRIVLIGCDFAYTDGHAGLPLPNSEGSLVPQPIPEEVVEWQGFKTCANMVLYVGQFLQYWPQITVPIYSMSHGILPLPAVTEGEVLRGKYPKPANRKYRREASARFRDQLREATSEGEGIAI